MLRFVSPRIPRQTEEKKDIRFGVVRRWIPLIAVTLPAFTFAACALITGDAKIGEGVVIAPTLSVRSSTAAVALDVGELKRGDRVEILEQAEVRTPTRIEEWYKVQSKSADSLVGWVEARSVINQTVVDKTQELYNQAQHIPSQGTGRLKVRTRLRIEPGGEVVTLLSRGTLVDIAGKARTTFTPEKQEDEEGGDEATEEPETRTVLWYQIRLQETEVLRAGWVGAQQVELDVPEEILHLEGEGRRFTGWLTIDQTRARSGEQKTNYIGLMKRLDVEGPIDFTRLWVITYSPGDGRYFGSYIEDGLRGLLPVTLKTESGIRGFTIHELDENGRPVQIEYEAVRKDQARIQVRRLSPKIQVKKQPGRR
jgi:hypothetical protein